MRAQLREYVDSSFFQTAIVLLIILNAIALGLLTMPLPDPVLRLLEIFDTFCLAVYVVEIALRLFAYGTGYFRDAWNVFDFVIVALSLVPYGILPVPVQVARVFRIFRTLRMLRLVSAFDQMRTIVEATLRAIPGVLWTTLLMFIVQYVYAIAGLSLFAEAFPHYFGDLGRALFTLFEIMTLEGWNGIAEDVLVVYPWAWVYFGSFVILSAFILMNVVVGVIVGSVDKAGQSIRAATDRLDGNDDELLAARLLDLQEQMEEVGRLLNDRSRSAARDHGDDTA